MKKPNHQTLPTSKAIEAICAEVCAMLKEKNASYGDSARVPVRIFSTVDNIEQLNVRIDDKLSRIARGRGTLKDTEDTELDLIGYLILKRALVKHG